MSVARVAVVLLMRSPRWVCGSSGSLYPNLPYLSRPDAVEQDAGRTEVEVRPLEPAQAQRRQPRAPQREVADDQATGVVDPGFVEAGAEQAGRRGRRPAVGDEVDFVDQPVVAVGRRHLEGAGREVVAQRGLA